MLGEFYVEQVLTKCKALKDARVWLTEPKLRPRAWLANFEKADQLIAAILLDHFTFYTDAMTERLLVSSYQSLADGLSKGPSAPERDALIDAVEQAVFTRVEGEKPKPTDSGNLFCRKARQVLRISDHRLLEPRDALEEAKNGNPVIFLDDFVGSGDQFCSTWRRKYGRSSKDSFRAVHDDNYFIAIYVTLIATDYGLKRLHKLAPSVAAATAHVLGEESTFRAIANHPAWKGEDLAQCIMRFLEKYSKKLHMENYMYNNDQWPLSGYKERGLMFAFEHSVPDATLPIFWAAGDNSWQPLVERR